jgi:hypothetical protein
MPPTDHFQGRSGSANHKAGDNCHTARDDDETRRRSSFHTEYDDSCFVRVGSASWRASGIWVNEHPPPVAVLPWPSSAGRRVPVRILYARTMCRRKGRMAGPQVVEAGCISNVHGQGSAEKYLLRSRPLQGSYGMRCASITKHRHGTDQEWGQEGGLPSRCPLCSLALHPPGLHCHL